MSQTAPTVAFPPSEPPRAGLNMPALAKAMVGVMRRVREVRKAGWNKEGKYDFISMGDVLAPVQDALVAEGLWVSQREVARTIVSKILFVKYELDIYHESGESILNAASHTGSCRFEFKSGTTDDKAMNKAFTAAEKRLLLGVFKIPADDHHTERASDGDPDSQGENEPLDPRSRDDRPDERDRRVQRGNGQDTRDEHRERADYRPPVDVPDNIDPRWDNAPPPQDVFPDSDRPTDPPYQGNNGPNPPPRDPAEQDHRQQVTALAKRLRAATNETDAVALWRDGKDVLEACNDTTYQWLRDEFDGRWHRPPPRIDD